MDINKIPTTMLKALQEELQAEKERAAKKFDREKVVDILFTQAEIEAVLNSRERQMRTEQEIAKFVKQGLRGQTC